VVGSRSGYLDHAQEGRVMTPEAALERAKVLYGGCTGGACVDIGVGVQHEPGCGTPIPEDVADAILKAYKEGEEHGKA